MIDSYLELIVNASSDSDTGGAKRATKASDSAAQEVIIEASEETSTSGRKTSAMKQAQAKTKADGGQKVTLDHTVSMDDFKQK